MNETLTSTTTGSTIDEARYAVTANGLAALHRELNRLQDEDAADMTERLRDARAYGDVANNDEYLAIMEDEAILEARIRRLEEIISQATVVADGASDGKVAGIGTAVFVEDAATGKTSRYLMVGAHQRPEKDEVSSGSPVGRALLGQPAGVTVSAELPNGLARRLRLVRIEAQTSANGAAAG